MAALAANVDDQNFIRGILLSHLGRCVYLLQRRPLYGHGRGATVQCEKHDVCEDASTGGERIYVAII